MPDEARDRRAAVVVRTVTAVIAFTLLAGSVVGAVWVYQHAPSWEIDAWNRRAPVGDFVAGFASIASAALFVFALVMQSIELSATRREMGRQKDAMERQARAVERSAIVAQFLDVFRMKLSADHESARTSLLYGKKVEFKVPDHAYDLLQSLAGSEGIDPGTRAIIVATLDAWRRK